MAARTKKPTFDLGLGEEVRGNRRSKEGLLISVHKHMLVIVPGAVPEGFGKTEGEYHGIPVVVQAGNLTSR